LAKEFGIEDPPNAAGGCLLTDPAFSKRVEDAIDHAEDIPSLNDIELLKVGRHFRLDERSKLIIGRNKDENEIISSLSAPSDIVIEARDYVGPTCLLRSSFPVQETVELAAGIALRYSDAPKESQSFVRVSTGGSTSEIQCSPAIDDGFQELRI
jgi:hypothetical protein